MKHMKCIGCKCPIGYCDGCRFDEDGSLHDEYNHTCDYCVHLGDQRNSCQRGHWTVCQEMHVNEQLNCIDFAEMSLNSLVAHVCRQEDLG